jgi:hypothetical protein
MQGEVRRTLDATRPSPARTSENSVQEKFAEFHFETVRKGLGKVCDVALWAAKRDFSAHFRYCIAAKYRAGVLLVPLFGQFLLRGWVNKGKKRRGQGTLSPGPLYVSPFR